MSETLEERIQRYRKMADAAHAAARGASSTEVRDAFIGIAAAWESFIDELLREVKPEERDRLLTGEVFKRITPPT